MTRVTIVGSGMAGMAAALRLLERGFEVRLYEQDDFMGGMMRSYDDPVTGTRREHSYHMFPNFYFNFWTIAGELGLQNNFTPRESFRFLRNKDLRDLPAVFNPGGPQQLLANIASYAVPPADMFIYMYSMIDMLAEPPEKAWILDKVSVNGFLHSRKYMTDTAAELHQTVWETVWAISSYQASLESYRTFIKYSNRYSVPELWLLAGNKEDYLIGPWRRKLESYGSKFQFHKLHRLKKVMPSGAGGRIDTLVFERVDNSPSIVNEVNQVGADIPVDVSRDAVILAVTPGAITKLVRDEFFEAAPKLSEVRYLRAEPMASLQLYLKRRLDNVPDDVTNLEGEDYYMTFLDYTQLWPGQQNTFLCVTCSDVDSLLGVPEEKRDAQHRLVIDLDNPTTGAELVMKQVLNHLPITLADVDLRKTSFDMNNGAELFANLVGSWERRPETETTLSNLWLAGTYVKNWVDVATIEGAVVTGLRAAEEIRRRYKPHADEIRILEPEAFPRELFVALKAAWAPAVMMAKASAMFNTAMDRFGPAWSNMQKRCIQAAANALKPLDGRPPNPPKDLGRLDWRVAVLDLPEGDPRAVGPLYWNYRRDGRIKTQDSSMESSPRGRKGGSTGKGGGGKKS